MYCNLQMEPCCGVVLWDLKIKRFSWRTEVCWFPLCPQLQDPFSAPLCPVLSLRNLYTASLRLLLHTYNWHTPGLASWETPTGELSGGRERPGKFFRCFGILSLIISATLRITFPMEALLCESTPIRRKHTISLPSSLQPLGWQSFLLWLVPECLPSHFVPHPAPTSRWCSFNRVFLI